MGATESVHLLPSASIDVTTFLGVWWRVASAPASTFPRTKWIISNNGSIVIEYYGPNNLPVAQVNGSLQVLCNETLLLSKIVPETHAVVEQDLLILRILPGVYALLMQADRTAIYLLSRAPVFPHSLIPEIMGVLSAYNIDPKVLVAPIGNVV